MRRRWPSLTDAEEARLFDVTICSTVTPYRAAISASESPSRATWMTAGNGDAGPAADERGGPPLGAVQSRYWSHVAKTELRQRVACHPGTTTLGRDPAWQR